jgi:hypothetical protein
MLRLRERQEDLSVLEVVADTEDGPRVLGLWVRPGLRFRPESAGPSEPDAWWAWQRTALGLPIGRPDSRLARAAARQAAFVCELGRAGHWGRFGETPDARARAEGVFGPVAENVAVARSAARAHRNLMVSPSHRRLIVDPHVEGFGTGLARADDRVCLVQLVVRSQR